MNEEHESEYGKHRFWEMFPGILVWTTLISAIVFSFISPIWVIIFIIVFDLYWLFRVGYFVVYIVISWRQYRRTTKENWMIKLKQQENWERIHHLVILPTYKEGIEILRATFRSLASTNFPNKRMIVVLAGEERDHEQFQKNAELIEQEFGSVFQRVIFTEHPKDLPNEIPGKGSNLNYTGHKVKEILESEFNIPVEDIVVSSFDVDTIAHEQYFAYLTYLYLTVPDPMNASYQPVALLANNIWTAPAPVRVASFGTTFWLLTELARPERLWTFSSHSMPWKMLIDVGFWQKDIVSEDSRIFLQAFVKYHGNYRVVPMFLPVSMDTVTGGNYMSALGALYKQQRRWAWGVEHLPVMIDSFRKDKIMPAWKKRKYLWNHIEGMYTWSTAPLLIFILGWLPLYSARGQSDALVQSAPFTLEVLMQLATIGVFASGILALTMLPPRPKTVKASTWVVMIFQWALLPITFVIFGAFPAIDAQTRLMLGKYLGFNVTKKSR